MTVTSKTFYTLGYLNVVLATICVIIDPRDWEIPLFALISGFITLYYGNKVRELENGEI